jgi:hypothetical protein
MPRISAAFTLTKLATSALFALSACSSGEAPGANSGATSAASAGAGNTAGSSAAGSTSVGGVSATAGRTSTPSVGGSSVVTFGGASGANTGGASSSGAAGTNSGGATNGGASGANTSGTINGGAAGTSERGGAGGVIGAAGGSTEPTTFFARYEAESALNTLTYPVERIATEGDTACPANGVKEGAVCASGGKVVAQILGRSPCNPPTSTSSYDGCQDKGGGVQFNQVMVPEDGTYDVTWWYHCGPDTPGHADVFGDAKCGGLDYGTGAGTGCRPHLIDVNGVSMSSTVAGKTALYYQFPCYTAPWSTLHGATTALPLKAGANTIYIHAPGATTLDAVDVDALDVQAAGHGSAPSPLWPKLVTPVVAPN